MKVFHAYFRKMPALMDVLYRVGEPKAVYETKNGVDFKPAPEKRKIVSILPALVKTFGPSFFFGGLLKVIQDCLGFVSPQILR